MQKLTPPATRWRMTDWLLVALALALVVFLIAPQQLPVSIYKLSLVSMAAVAGYWIDRSLFPYARPDGQLARELLEARPLIEVNGTAEECGSDDVCAMATAASNCDVYLLIAAMLRRAVIVAAAIMAVSLGA